MRFPLRRRPAATAFERADAHWERLKNRTAAVGLVGVFKDITPGAEAQKATFAYERIREDEVGSEGDGADGEKKFIVFADSRPNPLDDDAEPFTVSVPKPETANEA